MEENMANLIELIDENGETIEFEHVMTLSFEENEYIVLKVLEESDSEDEDDEVVIMKIASDENGDDIYLTIEDETEQQNVFDAFLEVLDAEDEA